MHAYTKKIREAAQRLLVEKKVDGVIGFRQGTIPMMSEPVMIRHVDQVDQLVWNSFCGVNLANYLVKRKDRVAVVAKGCDSRNMVLQMQENQFQRNQLYILGAPCHGMVDRRKIWAFLKGREPLQVTENGPELHVSGKGFEEVLRREEYLQDNCRICTHRNPVIYDELLGDLVSEQTGVDRYEDVRRVEAMPPQDKWRYFEELIASCIRCYACRNACPMCYCPTCFVDESRPQWVGKTLDATDTRTFHLLRAFHLAGRCTDCGACERACPMGISVRQFTKKLEKDVKELYGYEAGLVMEGRPPLDTYRPDDPQDFIK
ncbi:MAG: 4Fe-4S dicluster domain-containing protein [Desulfosoma sp.]